MAAMDNLLARVPDPTRLTPKQFADHYGDDDFDGNASRDAISGFMNMAFACIQASGILKPNSRMLLHIRSTALSFFRGL
jgi:hypothetical protein